MKKIRIAFIIELYGTAKHGGEQEAMAGLARRLQQSGEAEVQIFSYSGKDGKRLPRFFPARLGLAPFVRDVVVNPRLGRWIARHLHSEADLIHASATTLFSLARPPVPYVHSIHSIPSERAQELSSVSNYRLLPLKTASRLLRSFERRGLSRAQAVIVLKDETKTFLQAHHGLASERLIRIPNGVDANVFTPAPKRGKKILFVGRPTAVKGIDTLLDAAPLFHAPLIIIVPRADASLQQRAQAVGAQLHVRIPHDEIPPFYQQAGVFCLPSLKEDQPLTVLEAMATGIPSVVTLSAAADLIRDGVNGTIVPNRNPRALAKAVNDLIDHPSLADALGQASRAVALKEHAWESIVAQHLCLYRQLVMERTTAD